MNIIEAKMNRYGVNTRSGDLLTATLQENVTVADDGEVDEFSR